MCFSLLPSQKAKFWDRASLLENTDNPTQKPRQGMDAEGEVTAWLYGRKFLNLRPTQAHILSVLPLLHAKYIQRKLQSQSRI